MQVTQIVMDPVAAWPQVVAQIPGIHMALDKASDTNIDPDCSRAMNKAFLI